MARIIDNLRKVYTPKYIAFNIAVAVIYYLVINYLLILQEHGVALITVPMYLVYMLVVTASILFTISIHSIATNYLVRRSFGTSLFGTASTLFGGVVVGCGCSASLLGIALSGVGASMSTTIGAADFFSAYGSMILGILVVINLVLISVMLSSSQTKKRKK